MKYHQLHPPAYAQMKYDHSGNNSQSYRYCWIFFSFLVPFWFEKAGRVWYGGAQEAHWTTCHNRVTASKTKEFSDLPAFLDLDVIFSNIYENNKFSTMQYRSDERHSQVNTFIKASQSLSDRIFFEGNKLFK